MFDSDDIRYSKPEKRPPWELSTSTRLLDSFSSHKVDERRGPERCDDVERHKAQRQKAQDQKIKAHRQLQAELEAAQRQMDQDLGDLEKRLEHDAQASQPDHRAQAAQPDHRARRYDYSKAAYRPKNSSLRRKRSGVGIILVLALIISAVGGLVAGYREEMSYSEEVWPDDEGWSWEEDEPDGDSDEAEDSDEFRGGFGSEDYFGYDEDYEEYPQASDEELPRADLPGAMEVAIVSDEGKEPLSYQALYAKCAPSTVSITVYSSAGMGSGTGIVMTEDGYILTCEHVVSDSSSCQVMTWDDQLYEAELVGADPQTDLALLKIDAEGLTPAEFGNSNELTVGDEALAIGDPLGTELRGTLTNGIISAINRNVTVNSYSMTLLQTTAALNSGNSGGPLINIYGQVVGINNMKINSGEVTVEGLGFAVPTSVVREIIPELAAEGKISRPVLGITCYSITEEAAEAYDYPSAGLMIASVNQDSDCYRQGLRVGDMIYAVNGEAVSNVSQVKVFLDEMEAGDTLEISVYRFEDDPEDYEEFDLTVELVDQADIS